MCKLRLWTYYKHHVNNSPENTWWRCLMRKVALWYHKHRQHLSELYWYWNHPTSSSSVCCHTAFSTHTERLQNLSIWKEKNEWPFNVFSFTANHFPYYHARKAAWIFKCILKRTQRHNKLHFISRSFQQAFWRFLQDPQDIVNHFQCFL